ncbi:MAG: transglycosylase SLT domain-containing protein, partial [Myxococcota bacterium]
AAACTEGAEDEVRRIPTADAGTAAVPGPLGEEDVFADALTSHQRHHYVADLDEVKRRGVLRVISRNSSTSYFLHRGGEAGFNYELAKLLADELGVRLQMVVPRAPRDMVPWLLEGRGDIIIGSLPTDGPRAKRVRLTRPYLHSSHVVVTRRGRWSSPPTVTDIAGLTLLAHPSSSALPRLRQLSRETGLSLQVRAALESLHDEDLLDEVAAGAIDAAVVQRRVATVELAHRSDLEVSFELPTGVVESAFAVHPESPALWAAADDFLRRHYRGTVFNILYARYHKKTRRAGDARDAELRADTGGALTEWDTHFQQSATTHSLDWRLLVAQAFQESRLDPKAQSPYGAQGLLQIIPSTAAELGVKDPFVAEQSIEGGARYLRKLIDRYVAPDIDLKNSIRFALAAYNAGPGHVDDARALAVREGKDPTRWFGHVEEAMRLLSKPRYYEAARYGYCRGEEPVRYVSQIQTRYDAYVAMTAAGRQRQDNKR